eukprot:5182058-Pleurochrysis_carterae.AAC.1
MTNTFSEVCRADAHTQSPQNFSRMHRRRRYIPPLSLTHLLPVQSTCSVGPLQVFLPVLPYDFSLLRATPDLFGLALLNSTCLQSLCETVSRHLYVTTRIFLRQERENSKAVRGQVGEEPPRVCLGAQKKAC